MTVFDRIKELSDKKMITIAELERRANLGNGTIRRWDKTLPSADKLQRVGEILGVTIDYLVNGEDETNSKGVILARKTGQLTDAQLELLHSMIDDMLKKEWSYWENVKEKLEKVMFMK